MNVSRSTFYRLFDHMDDVISYLCMKNFDSITDEIQNHNEINYYDIILLFVKRWMEHDDLLKLTVQIHREDILYDCHLIHFDRIRKVIANSIKDDHFVAYQISFLCSIMTSTLLTWVKEGKQESPEELVECITSIMGDIYHLMRKHAIEAHTESY